jgi:hypothetical protein
VGVSWLTISSCSLFSKKCTLYQNRWVHAMTLIHMCQYEIITNVSVMGTGTGTGTVLPLLVAIYVTNIIELSGSQLSRTLIALSHLDTTRIQSFPTQFLATAYSSLAVPLTSQNRCSCSGPSWLCLALRPLRWEFWSSQCNIFAAALDATPVVLTHINTTTSDSSSSVEGVSPKRYQTNKRRTVSYCAYQQGQLTH